MLHFLPLGYLNSSTTKKRPHSILFGWLYNHALLDMFELQITKVEGSPEDAFKYIDLSIKPSVVVIGDVFETNLIHGRIRNFFTDLFAGSN